MYTTVSIHIINIINKYSITPHSWKDSLQHSWVVALQNLGLPDFFQAVGKGWDGSELQYIQVSWWESDVGPADLLF